MEAPAVAKASSGLTEADKLFYTYCGLDCCVTHECNSVMDKRLMPGQRKHYEFNMSLLPAILWMELRGIRYDYEKAKAKLKRTQKWAFVLQDIVNRAGGVRLPEKGLEVASRPESVEAGRGDNVGQAASDASACQGAPASESSWIELIRGSLCLAKPRRRKEVTTTRTFKNGKTKVTTKTVSEPVGIQTLEDCKEFVLPSQKGAMRRVCALLNSEFLSRAGRGELSVLLGQHVKVNSTGANGDACKFLYSTCGFPVQYQKEGNRLTCRPASDDEALLHIWLKTKDKRCKAFLLLRRLLTKVETLRVGVDADKRIRTAYNLVATKTGRMAAYASPTGNGYNTQTTTKSDRDLFLADEGCDMWQRDLSAADAWTVAAEAAMQGDSTMLDDMRAGLKPAKIVCLLHDQGLVVNQWSRERIREECAKVDENGWLYHASKATVYGSSYGMYERTMSENLLIQSFKKSGKPIAVPPAMCKRLQELFFARYPGIRRWHAHMERQLKSTGMLICPSGLKRLFFGRKDEPATLRDALSHEPQNNTTWVLNRAIAALWYDPENRRADGSLIAEPLHQIHDAALFQAPVEMREWVAARSDRWFDNPINIAGQEVTIPAGKEYGKNWKEMVKWRASGPSA